VLWMAAAWNKGFFSNITYVRCFRLYGAVAWFTTGIVYTGGELPVWMSLV